MKRCPQCLQTYTDETLKFCRDDGTLLQDNGSLAAESSDTSILPAALTGDTPPTRILHSETAQAQGTTSPIEATREARTGGAGHTHPTSSAEHLADGINRRQRRVTTVLVVLLLAVGGVCYWLFGNRPGSPDFAQIESIAVLPFVNESGNADVEYLSDGMTETLISSLSQVPKLNVKARSSVFRYKGKEVSPQTVGTDLNVQAVLTGRVVQRDDELTLYLSLIDAKTENQIWGTQYNRKLTNLVALQTEIARDVVDNLKTKLTGADEQRLAKNYTANVEAYQLYLRGRFYWNKRNVKDIRKAIEYFEQALALDPNYALAYAGLADAYQVLPSYANVLPEGTYLKAHAAAQKALEIDGTLAEPHAALGVVLHQYEWNFVEAEREFKRAIELKPNYASAHQWYAEYLLNMGRVDEALAEVKRAQEIDPLSVVINTVVGYAYYVARRHDDAIAQYRKTLELDPNFARVRGLLADALIEKGMYEEAQDERLKLRILLGAPKEQVERNVAAIREAYRKSGARGFWQKAFEIEKEAARKRREEIPPITLAFWHVKLGDKEQALYWLEKAYQDDKNLINRNLCALKANPVWQPLHSEARFQDLLRRVGLPP